MALSLRKPVLATGFLARDIGGNVLHVGEVNPRLGVVTGQPILEFDDDKGLYLALLSAFATKYPLLPSRGEELTTDGEFYQHDGEVVEVREAHIRTNVEPIDAPDLFFVVRPSGFKIDWKGRERVVRGTVRTFDGDDWKCILDHVTEASDNPTLSEGRLWEMQGEPWSDRTLWSDDTGWIEERK